MIRPDLKRPAGCWNEHFHFWRSIWHPKMVIKFPIIIKTIETETLHQEENIYHWRISGPTFLVVDPTASWIYRTETGALQFHRQQLKSVQTGKYSIDPFWIFEILRQFHFTFWNNIYLPSILSFKLFSFEFSDKFAAKIRFISTFTKETNSLQMKFYERKIDTVRMSSNALESWKGIWINKQSGLSTFVSHMLLSVCFCFSFLFSLVFAQPTGTESWQ